MELVSERVSKLLIDPDGDVKGMLLENSREIRFSSDLGPAVASIVEEGCRVRIVGIRRSDSFSDGYLQATLITNLDSGQSAALPAPNQEGKPGMRFITPRETASLAPTASASGEGQHNLPCETTSLCSSPHEHVSDEDSKALTPGSFFHRLPKGDGSKGAEFARNGSARSIGLAYDNLHRIQAILAYLHIMKHRVPGISQFLDEAKHTYEQALSRFATRDFAGAKEFAEASVSLSRIVEIVMARTLRSDDSLPSLVPPPPENRGAFPEPGKVEENLTRAETVLSRIHWVLENGTLPSDERAQVRKIASWGDAFYKQAQHRYSSAVPEDAAEFAQAALAGACSAEHVCRKWYVSHPVET